MPTLDLSDAFDDSFLDILTVVRQTGIVDQHGWVQITTRSFTIQAVVVAAPPNELARLPEEEYMNKSISVSAIADQNKDGSAVLQGPSDTTLPDEIIWHGSKYIVRTISDYTGYGRGFVNATAVSVNAVDPPPAPQPPMPTQQYPH